MPGTASFPPGLSEKNAVTKNNPTIAIPMYFKYWLLPIRGYAGLDFIVAHLFLLSYGATPVTPDKFGSASKAVWVRLFVQRVCCTLVCNYVVSIILKGVFKDGKAGCCSR